MVYEQLPTGQIDVHENKCVTNYQGYKQQIIFLKYGTNHRVDSLTRKIPNDPMDPCIHKRFLQVESYVCPACITLSSHLDLYLRSPFVHQLHMACSFSSLLLAT